jgi:hypothetical protein
MVVSRSSFPVLTRASTDVSTRKNSDARKKDSAGRGCEELEAEAVIG